MSLGLVGRKVGMTRIFAEDGASIPVTVLDVSNNRVTQVKTPEIDGYAAIQVTFGQRANAFDTAGSSPFEASKAALAIGERTNVFSQASSQ